MPESPEIRKREKPFRFSNPLLEDAERVVLDLQQEAIQAGIPLSEATVSGHFTALDLLQGQIHGCVHHCSAEELPQRAIDFIDHMIAISSASEREPTEYSQGIEQGLATIRDFLQSQIPQATLSLVPQRRLLSKAA